MEFSPNDEQIALRDSVERFVAESHDFARARAIAADDAGYCREHWAAFADLGWLALMVSQEHGGIGASVEDAALVMEEFGKGLVAAPFLSTAVLGVELLEKSTDFISAPAELERIVAGKSLIALASEELQSRYEVSAVSTFANVEAQGTYTLTGRKIAVLDGGSANAFIVSALVPPGRTHGGMALFFVPADTPGLQVHPYRTIDGRRSANLILNGVGLSGSALMAGPDVAVEILSRAVDRVRVLLAAEALGAMAAAMDLTASHLKTRQQFGKPLASFQVLRHQMSNMFVKLETARSLVMRGMSVLDFAPAERAAAVSATSIAVIQAGEFIGGQAIQLHGGIGMAEENAVGHYYKRLRAIGKTYGDQSFHVRRYIDLTIKQGSVFQTMEAPERVRPKFRDEPAIVTQHHDART